MNREEVLKLAKLARIDISDGEAEGLSHEFDAILKYVSEIKNANLPKNVTPAMPVKNVLREDGEPHKSGAYTEAILAEVPSREGDFVRVKKIL